MNKAQTADFFPIIDEEHSLLVAPNIYQVYRETDEDFRHEELLKNVELKLNEERLTDSKEEWGDFPYDAESDHQRWDQLEKDFDQVFQRQHSSG